MNLEICLAPLRFKTLQFLCVPVLLTLNWILLGLDNANHNVGCLEPDNITVNTKRLGDSLKDHLIAKGVKFSNGKEVKLVTRNNQIHCVQDGDMIIKGKEVQKWKSLFTKSFFTSVLHKDQSEKIVTLTPLSIIV